MRMPGQHIPLSGISSGASNEVETLTVTAVSDNLALLANPAVTYSSPGSSGALDFAPLPNAHGTANITVTVNDGGTSNNSVVRIFTVTVVGPPRITGQPQGQTVTNGGTASFSVTTSGTLPIFFQWKRDGTDLVGRTNATLTLTNVQASEAGSYSVMATNPAGQAVSGAAVLRVLMTPRITAISQASSAAQISFSTQAGLSYTVEFKNAPDSPGWNPLAPVVGTGVDMTVTDPAATAASRIYRVRVE